MLVGHDWGGALAFDWAARHPGRVRGVAITETINVVPKLLLTFDPGPGTMMGPDIIDWCNGVNADSEV